MTFYSAQGRATITKRHLCKCGIGKHNNKKIVMLPGTLTSAFPWQRFVAGISSLLKGTEFSAEARAVSFCDTNCLSFVSQSVCVAA